VLPRALGRAERSEARLNARGGDLEFLAWVSFFGCVCGFLFLVACIPSTKGRKAPLDYDKALYRQRHKIENLFAKLKNYRRIATRYDRCAHAFFSAVL
jgi:transposase